MAITIRTGGMTIRAGGEREWPGAVMAHRIPTLEDACLPYDVLVG
jgi:hypothetical protein